MNSVRVRFAPSPTGALHIGGVRTALYNYLFARKHGGTFILRVEDTDQGRFVPGAEEYILESLRWCGLLPDEGLGFGGPHGPYRQSERKEIYRQYADQLVASGKAFLAFDTPEELEARRSQDPSFKYDARTRMQLRNSLSLSENEVRDLLDQHTPCVIRLLVPDDQPIHIYDLVREDVVFQSGELDDKVLIKADGMPTYHMANIVDDHLMEITHVIRGEEWLSSTAHHMLLYQAFGWAPPQFAHLPLILKPSGKGKLSKRDGMALGIPVFPIGWVGKGPEVSFQGFREFGFLPEAALNFLAFLGWNPGTEQEIFSLEELAQTFSLEKIGKSGARFDYDKAKWFNHQYLVHTDDERLASLVRPLIEAQGHNPEEDFLRAFVGLMKERVSLLTEFWEAGYYFFEPIREYDHDTLRKKWKPELGPVFDLLREKILNSSWESRDAWESGVKQLMDANGWKPGDVFPLLRIALAGTMKGPDVFSMMHLLGKAASAERLARFQTITPNS